MRASHLIFALVILAGIGAVIWQIAGSESPKVEKPATEEAPVAAASRAESHEVAGAPAIVPRPFRETELIDEPPATRAQPAPDGRKLSVVLAPNDLPASGAVVDFTPLGEFANETGHTTRGLVADVEGIVRLPKFRGYGEVRGRLGAHAGREMLSSGSFEPLTLRLEAGVAVRVVDVAGVPQASVPVAVVQEGYYPPAYDRATTGTDGIAFLATPRRERGTRTAPIALTVAISIPLEPPVSSPLDQKASAGDPITLVLPPTGRIEVRLVTSDRRPFLGAATVVLQAVEDAGVRFLGERADAVRAQSAGGVATFPFVGMGPKLEIGIIPADPTLRRVDDTLDGPRAAEATFTMECGGRATTVTGRIVRGGKPVAGTSVEVKLPVIEGKSRAEPYTRPSHVLTTADGRFTARFDVDPASIVPGDAQLAIRLDDPMAGPGAFLDRNQEVGAVVPDSIKTGTADLGEIVAPDLQAFASGKVVDSDGNGIQSAKVSVVRRVGTSSWTRSWELHETKTISGPGGRFELKGENTDRGALGLSAERDGWICLEPTPFQIGARDLKVTMVKAGSIVGSITGLDRSERGIWTGSPVSVFVVKSEASARPRERQTRDGPDPDRREVSVYAGSFKSESLRPGTYVVEFHAGEYPSEDSHPLLVVDGVVVTAGVVTKDPRLQDIELSKLLKTRVVTIVDEQGRPLKGARIGVRAVGSSGRFDEYATSPEGKANAASTAETVEVVASLKGYRSAVQSPVTGDVTITLAKSAPKRVVVKLAEDVQLPSPPFSIGIEINFLAPPGEAVPAEPAGYDPRGRDLPAVHVGLDRTATFEVYDVGVYAIQIWLYEESARGRSGSGVVPTNQNPTVTVAEDGGACTVTVDPERMKEIIGQKKK